MAAPAEQRVVDNVRNGLYIGGEWRDATASATLEVRDPSTAEVICEVADASPDDGAAALAAAADAQPDWAARPPRERGEILRRAFYALLDQQDDLALLMTLEMGKPVAESRRPRSPTRRSSSAGSPRRPSGIEGSYRVAPGGGSRAAHDAAAGWAVPADHAVELPDGHGHPQDRSGNSRGLHDGDQAGRGRPRCPCWRWRGCWRRPAFRRAC